MNASGNNSHREELIKAKTLNRVIAKAIDFIIVVALLEMVPKVGYFAGLFYLLIADGLFEGRSLGKRLTGLKVVLYETGGICGIKSSVIRNFTFVIGYIFFGILRPIPLIGWILAIIVLVVILIFESLVMIGSDKGMRLGDEVAKTQVLEERLMVAGSKVGS